MYRFDDQDPPLLATPRSMDPFAVKVLTISTGSVLTQERAVFEVKEIPPEHIETAKRFDLLPETSGGREESMAGVSAQGER